MTTSIIQGNSLEALSQLPADSVNVVCTSPPYFGLRSYAIEPVVWGGTDGCQHRWQDASYVRNNDKTAGAKQNTNTGAVGRDEPVNSAFCALCGAWRGCLGLEPTVDLFVEHLVSIFDEVRRVLHPTGVVLVNIADSYAGSGQGGGGIEPEDGYIHRRQPPNGLKPLDLCLVPERFVLAMQRAGWYVRDRLAWCKTSAMPESVQGTRWERCRVKVKRGQYGRGNNKTHGVGYETEGQITTKYDTLNLWREDSNNKTEWADCPGCPKCAPNGGYVLRKGSWRTTRAWEYVFMFAKTDSYMCDGEGAKEDAVMASGKSGFGGPKNNTGELAHTNQHGKAWDKESTRNPRSWFKLKADLWWVNPTTGNPMTIMYREDIPDDMLQYFEPLPPALLDVFTSQFTIPNEPANWDFCEACGAWFGKNGHNRKSIKRWQEDGQHHAKCPNCQTVDEFVAHYALFPIGLPTRLLKSAPKQVCSVCGAPWAPVVEKKASTMNIRVRDAKKGITEKEGIAATESEIEGYSKEEMGSSKVLSYRPTCTCDAAPKPGVVLDPFSGAASTLIAADRLGLDAIGIELSEAYVKLSQARIAAEGPMFGGEV